MILTAAPGLNGKINVQILDVNDASLQIYRMPNSFNPSFGTQGIFENNMYDNYIKTGLFVVPTDWTIWIVYNKPVFEGSVSIITWLEEYGPDDKAIIETEWQPTGTFWVDKAA